MGMYTEKIANVTGVVAAAETAIAPDWTPALGGRLKKIRVVCGSTAATSLIEAGYIKLSSSTFGGVDLICPFQGNGLATAPRTETRQNETVCDLAITTKPIKLFYYHDVTPTTPIIGVYADIQA